MKPVGSESNPLRVAIIGSGPTGFYAAGFLLKEDDLAVEIDMYDRLPTPFGLVRFGVAPDHPKIKSVTKAYDRIAQDPRVRFFGYVEFGKDILLADLKAHYHQAIFTTGAQTDRRLNIPGIDLEGSHPATQFVAWYNGHPDFQDHHFDLSGERAAVIGVGNVAMDVARILSRTPEELKETDIADYALDALSRSGIKEVYILGRRGPAQAKFTNPELKELGELEDAGLVILPQEAELDPLSQEVLASTNDRALLKKVDMIQDFAHREPEVKTKTLTLRFLVSPAALYDDGNGRVCGMRLVRNELYATEAGTLRPRATDQFEDLPVDLVFRSIGYRGVALPEIPFNEDWGVILNEGGRVLDPETKKPLPGLYTAGWIKRGPTGVIGTNKPDAGETVRYMLEDIRAGISFNPEHPEPGEAEALVASRQPNYFSYEDWLRIDSLEIERGKALGRPRVKFTEINEMLKALGRTHQVPL